MATAPTPSNKPRAIEAAVVSALIILVPLLQPYIEHLSNGTLLESIFSAVIVAAVAFIKSLASPTDTTSIVTDLESLKSELGVTQTELTSTSTTATLAHTTAVKAQADARVAVAQLNPIASEAAQGGV